MFFVSAKHIAVVRLQNQSVKQKQKQLIQQKSFINDLFEEVAEQKR